MRIFEWFLFRIEKALQKIFDGDAWYFKNIFLKVLKALTRLKKLRAK
jgi:hypothetical protein